MSTEQVNEGRRWNADHNERMRSVRRVVCVPAEPRSTVVKRQAEAVLTGLVVGRGLRNLWRLWH